MQSSSSTLNTRDYPGEQTERRSEEYRVPEGEEGWSARSLTSKAWARSWSALIEKPAEEWMRAKSCRAEDNWRAVLDDCFCEFSSETKDSRREIAASLSPAASRSSTSSLQLQAAYASASAEARPSLRSIFRLGRASDFQRSRIPSLCPLSIFFNLYPFIFHNFG